MSRNRAARRARRVASGALTLALFGACSGPANVHAELAVRPLGSDAPWGTELLSDEHLVTRIAVPTRTAAIRAQPRPGSKVVSWLHTKTELGYSETYLLLRSHTDSRSGGVWFKVRIPGRPNGRTGWVRRPFLGEPTEIETKLLVRRGRSATFYERGRAVFTFPVGTGATGTPTPPGRFWIREKLAAGGGAYGPYAFGTSAYSALSDWPYGGVVGIHGTNRPGLIPGRPSNGCIRVRNHIAIQLYRRMPVGTPVHVV